MHEALGLAASSAKQNKKLHRQLQNTQQLQFCAFILEK
jgi:hypothetical protein